MMCYISVRFWQQPKQIGHAANFGPSKSIWNPLDTWPAHKTSSYRLSDHTRCFLGPPPKHPNEVKTSLDINKLAGEWYEQMLGGSKVSHDFTVTGSCEVPWVPKLCQSSSEFDRRGIPCICCRIFMAQSLFSIFTRPAYS